MVMSGRSQRSVTRRRLFPPGSSVAGTAEQRPSSCRTSLVGSVIGYSSPRTVTRCISKRLRMPSGLSATTRSSSKSTEPTLNRRNATAPPSASALSLLRGRISLHRLDQLCRASQPHDADEHAPVHATDERLLKEGREPLCCCGDLHDALQLLSSSSLATDGEEQPSHARDGGRDRYSTVDCGRHAEPAGASQARHPSSRKSNKLKLTHYPPFRLLADLGELW